MYWHSVNGSIFTKTKKNNNTYKNKMERRNSQILPYAIFGLKSSFVFSRNKLLDDDALSVDDDAFDEL